MTNICSIFLFLWPPIIMNYFPFPERVWDDGETTVVGPITYSLPRTYFTILLWLVPDKFTGHKKGSGGGKG